MKEKKKLISERNREANKKLITLTNNYRRIQADEILLTDFCLRRFTVDTGETLQRLIVKFLMAGMNTEPYVQRFDVFKKEFSEFSEQLNDSPASV